MQVQFPTIGFYQETHVRLAMSCKAPAWDFIHAVCLIREALRPPLFRCHTTSSIWLIIQLHQRGLVPGHATLSSRIHVGTHLLDDDQEQNCAVWLKTENVFCDGLVSVPEAVPALASLLAHALHIKQQRTGSATAQFCCSRQSYDCISQRGAIRQVRWRVGGGRSFF